MTENQTENRPEPMQEPEQQNQQPRTPEPGQNQPNQLEGAGQVPGKPEQLTEQKQRKPRKEYTREEMEKLLEGGQVRGRKGVKHSRINMAFSPSNYDYIRVMSRVRGESMTDFVNHIIDHYKKEYSEQFETALDFLKSF